MKKLGRINTLNAAAEWLATALNDSGITPEYLVEQGRLQALKLRVCITPQSIVLPTGGKGYGLRLPYFDGLVDFNAMHCHLLQAQGAVLIDKAVDKGTPYPLREEISVTLDMLRVSKKELERYASAHLVTSPQPAVSLSPSSCDVVHQPERATKENLEQIPGKLPRAAIGKVVVKAAWELECQKGRRATAKEVMARLQEWAKEGTEPDVLKESIPHGVRWITAKGKEKPHDVEACGKALGTWKKSRDLVKKSGA